MRNLQQIIHFWKSLDPANIFNVQKHLQNLESLNVYSRKTENVQIPCKGVFAKICAKIPLQKYVQTFLCKNYAAYFCFVLGFPKSYKMLKSNKLEVGLNKYLN